jgi:hypothetical protein
MIFYHFTWDDQELIEKIQKEGIRPFAPYEVGRGGEARTFPPMFDPVVWLSARKTPCEDFDGQFLLRIKISLPANSRGLHHWPKWAKKNAPEFLSGILAGKKHPDPNDHLSGWVVRGWQDFWIYTGTIKPARFIAIEPWPGPGYAVTSQEDD